MSDQLVKAVTRIVKQELREMLNRQKKTDKIIAELQKQISLLENRLVESKAAPKAKRGRKKTNAAKPAEPAFSPELLIGKLQEYRQNNQLSAREIAKQLGVTYITYHSWETGKRKPQREKLRQITELLSMQVKRAKTGKKQLSSRRESPDALPKE